jgi:hypothetical protein
VTDASKGLALGGIAGSIGDAERRKGSETNAARASSAPVVSRLRSCPHYSCCYCCNEWSRACSIQFGFSCCPQRVVSHVHYPDGPPKILLLQKVGSVSNRSRIDAKL